MAFKSRSTLSTIGRFQELQNTWSIDANCSLSLHKFGRE